MAMGSIYPQNASIIHGNAPKVVGSTFINDTLGRTTGSGDTAPHSCQAKQQHSHDITAVERSNLTFRF